MFNPPNKNAKIANPNKRYKMYLLNFIKPLVALSAISEVASYSNNEVI